MNVQFGNAVTRPLEPTPWGGERGNEWMSEEEVVRGQVQGGRVAGSKQMRISVVMKHVPDSLVKRETLERRALEARQVRWEEKDLSASSRAARHVCECSLLACIPTK